VSSAFSLLGSLIWLLSAVPLTVGAADEIKIASTGPGLSTLPSRSPREKDFSATKGSTC